MKPYDQKTNARGSTVRPITIGVDQDNQCILFVQPNLENNATRVSNDLQLSTVTIFLKVEPQM